MISLIKLKTILTMSAVFALGAIVGASWSGILVSRNTPSAPSLLQRSKPGIVEKFNTRLRLSPQQKQQVESILDQTHHEFNELHLAVKPQFEEIRQKMRSAIQQILREEQKKDYQAMLRESDERRAAGRKAGTH